MPSLHHYLNSLVPRPLILLGDFNFPNIDWNSLTGSTHSTNLFCDLVFDLNLKQMVNFPAHLKGNTLDLVLANCPDLIVNVSALQGKSICSLSDHIPVIIQSSLLCTDSRKPNPSVSVSYLFKKGDYQAMELFCNRLIWTTF